MSKKDNIRKWLGVVHVATNLHLIVKRKRIEKFRDQVLKDVQFLQESLEKWNDDDKGHFSRAAKQLVEAALAETAIAFKSLPSEMEVAECLK